MKWVALKVGMQGDMGSLVDKSKLWTSVRWLLETAWNPH
jgi:hypothetical protein